MKSRTVTNLGHVLHAFAITGVVAMVIDLCGTFGVFMYSLFTHKNGEWATWLMIVQGLNGGMVAIGMFLMNLFDKKTKFVELGLDDQGRQVVVPPRDFKKHNDLSIIAGGFAFMGTAVYRSLCLNYTLHNSSSFWSWWQLILLVGAVCFILSILIEKDWRVASNDKPAEQPS